MFKDKLYSIKKDLQKHTRDPDNVLEEAIKDRLTVSLINYMDDLNKSYLYVSDKNSMNIMKTLNRKG